MKIVKILYKVVYGHFDARIAQVVTSTVFKSVDTVIPYYRIPLHDLDLRLRDEVIRVQLRALVRREAERGLGKVL